MKRDIEPVKTHYDTYGELAEKIDSPILISGRNSFHDHAIAAIVDDVKTKLGLDRSQRLLEIGCNVGLLLSPLAAEVNEAVGVDHPSLVAKYRELGVPKNVTLVPGCWPDVEVDRGFDRILVCAVMQYLPGKEAALGFINACVDSLDPGGLLLLADLPNEDMRRRYLESSSGRRFSEEYDSLRERSRARETKGEYAARDRIYSKGHMDIYLDDAFSLNLLKEMRLRGHDAFVLPQPQGLPFCFSREDILIGRRA